MNMAQSDFRLKANEFRKIYYTQTAMFSVHVHEDQSESLHFMTYLLSVMNLYLFILKRFIAVHRKWFCL